MIRNIFSYSEHLHQAMKMLDNTQGWLHAAWAGHETFVQMKATRKRTTHGA